MAPETKDLLERALRLPLSDRADLAAQLLRSLEEDEVDDPALVAREWREELARRAQEIADGSAQTIPFDEALARAKEIVARARAERNRT